VSPRETLQAKTERLLVSGRVRIRTANVMGVHALVEGDHGTHEVRFDGELWRCSCPSYHPCSHMAAVRLVAPGPETCAEKRDPFEGISP
jgi:hypothetical protein